MRATTGLAMCLGDGEVFALFSLKIINLIFVASMIVILVPLAYLAGLFTLVTIMVTIMIELSLPITFQDLAFLIWGSEILT